eukprot:gene41000-54306_t
MLSKFTQWATHPNKKRVYTFSEGTLEDRNLLGIKGSNLCEMTRMGLPVPIEKLFMILRGRQDISNQWRPNSVLSMNDTMLIFMPHGINTRGTEFPYSSIVDWSVVDNENLRPNDSGINIRMDDDEVIYFGVMHVRDLKHTMEYYWNKFQVEHGRPVRAGSTHGRPIVTLHTLTGKVSVPPAPVGLTEVFDENGAVVRPGQVYVKKQAGTVSGVATSAGLSTAQKTTIMENLNVKSHWNRV